MDMVMEKAYAKLNLTLGVLYKRMDGYHALDSLMQSVSLCDEVTVRRARSVEMTCSGMQLPYDNTVRRALEKYRRLTGHGASVQLVKRIPAEAGLGGGSSDAAAALRGMQRLYNGLSGGLLRELALSIGADVPFCLDGGTARAEGVGEILSPIQSPTLHFVIVKPEKGVSTKLLFSRLPLPRKKPDTAAAMRALAAGDAAALGKLLYNALEEPAIELVPEIGDYKRRLMDGGALGACMSGSGSAVFGLFESAEEAAAAREAFPDAAFSCCCETR